VVFEEIFERTGSRGGFMLGRSQCGPRDLLKNIVDLLVPELQRRSPPPHRLDWPHLARKPGHLSRGKGMAVPMTLGHGVAAIIDVTLRYNPWSCVSG
jgi:hypothetical protein